MTQKYLTPRQFTMLPAATAAVLRKAGVTRFYPISEEQAQVGGFEGAKSNIRTGTVWGPVGDTETGLMITAHEAGHIATNKTARGPTSAVELAATQWGLGALAEVGVTITPAMRSAAAEALDSYVTTNPLEAALWRMLGQPVDPGTPEVHAFIAANLNQSATQEVA